MFLSPSLCPLSRSHKNYLNASKFMHAIYVYYSSLFIGNGVYRINILYARIQKEFGYMTIYEEEHWTCFLISLIDILKST